VAQYAAVWVAQHAPVWVAQYAPVWVAQYGRYIQLMLLGTRFAIVHTAQTRDGSAPSQ